MTFKNLFIEHDRSKEVEEWIKEESAEQELRYTKIAQQMDDLAPIREKWYQEFFDRISTAGFNEDGDLKIPVKPEDLPVKPEGLKDQVIWKYGVDGE